MVRFALFWLTGGSILAAAGFFPTPSSAEFPDFLKSSSSVDVETAPVHPALPADKPIFLVEAPQTLPGPIAVVRPAPRPAGLGLQDDAEEGAAFSLERIVATAGRAISQVVEQRVSVEEPAPQPAALVASIVNFEHDQASLDPFASAKLNAMITWLNENPKQSVTVFGHTDLTGAEAYNENLGLKRAETVADYLTDNGISADRISAIESFGETAPLVQTEGESRENRRVLIQTVQSL